MNILKQRFVGRLTNSDTSRNAAMQVTLCVDDQSLQIIVDGDEEWAFAKAEVVLSQVSIDRFRLHLAGEDLYFLPVDPLGFVREVMEEFSEAPVEPYRGWLRRRIDEAQAQDDDPVSHMDEPALDEEHTQTQQRASLGTLHRIESGVIEFNRSKDHSPDSAVAVA